jgi:ribonuclease Z
MKRLLLGLLAVVVALALLVYALQTRLVLRLVESRVAANASASLLDDLPDGLHVALCGAGSPLPDPARSGPCVAVIAGDRLFVVDVGAGASRILSRIRIPQGRVDAVFLSHFHSDHIDGLGELLLQRWINRGAEEPTPVVGPEGVASVVDGFNRAYQLDRGYRVAHHGEAIAPPRGHGGEARAFAVPPPGEGETVWSGDGIRVTAFRVDHSPIEPAVGFRFDYGGRSAVLSGDTVKSASVERFARGADLLVHEALASSLVAAMTRGLERAGRPSLAKITTDILDYHATPVEAAEVARDAGVGHLLYYHIVPPLLLAPMEAVFLEGVGEVYEGPVTLGRDGTLVMLPAGSDVIDVRELL